MPNHPDMSRATWRKSSRSGQNGNCVEVAGFTGAVAFRDSKNTEGDVILLPASGFAALLASVRAGRYDLS